MREGPSRASDEREPSRRHAQAPGPSVVLMLVYALIAIALFFAFPLSAAKAISYSEFLGMVRADLVARVAIAEHRIRGTLKEGNQAFETMRIEDSRLLEELERHGVTFTGEIESTWWTNMIGWLLPLFIMILSERRSVLDVLAARLMEQEVVEGADVRALVEQRTSPAPQAA